MKLLHLGLDETVLKRRELCEPYLFPSASIIFPAFPWLSLPHIEPSIVLSCGVACLIFDGCRALKVHYK